MQNVVLIRLSSYVTGVSPPLGIGYLINVLEKIEGIQTIFIDCQLEKIEVSELIERVRSYHPILIGFQLYSVNYHVFRQLLPVLRQVCPRSVLAAGGPHVSGLPEYMLTHNPELDYVIQGEGEEAVLGLVKGIREDNLPGSAGDIPNLVYRADGRCRCNPVQLVDVDRYGWPAWEKLHPERYPAVQHGTFHRGRRVVPVLTSRGCPFPCTYCAGHVVTGKKIRHRNLESILEEIEFLHRRHGFDEFTIEDENFAVDKARVMEFSGGIRRRNLHCWFSFPNGLRVDRLDEEIIQALQAMGTYMVGLGIESASERILKSIKKPWDLQDVRYKIALLKRYGIVVSGFFILGFPNELQEDMEKTIRFALDSGMDRAYFGNYIPLPGSEDFQRLIMDGELNLESLDWSAYTTYLGRIPYHPKSVTETGLLKIIRSATLRFYLRPRILFKFLRQIIRPAMMGTLVRRIFLLFGISSGYSLFSRRRDRHPAGTA
ncbi:MAG: radical SAM protein [bacterium]